MVENLVIGGGLAGAMTALRLTAAGRDVLLLEREAAGHHKVCGEFLSPEAVGYLRQAGVDPLQLGAMPIRSLRLSVRNRVVETLLPFPALSLSRRVLDAALLERAAMEGCRVCAGVGVESLRQIDGGPPAPGAWSAGLADGSLQPAQTVFLATGKHDLRGWSRGTGKQGDLIGFKVHFRLTGEQTVALREFMDLFLFSGGYGGLSLVEGEVANLCLVVRRSALRNLGGWKELLAALLAENRQIRTRLGGAVPLWERPLAVSSIPYGYVADAPRGLWCVGDQAAVIPSFTGDGMSIALHSGRLAAAMHLAGATPEEYQRTLRGQLKSGMMLATLLSQTMVTSAGRACAPWGLTLMPSAMRWIAQATRIPDRALRHSAELTAR
jgi:flavin-dependent dehydrogenase